jgi:hypothetical protein
MHSFLVAEVSVPKDSSNFRLPTLRSVNGCRVACCVHHSVLRLLFAGKELWDLSTWGLGQGSRHR